MSAPVYTWQPTPAQRICAWCQMELSPGSQPATHGICPKCNVEFTRADKRRQEGGAPNDAA